jgi:ABC-type nitrate/sulfonate/bicarbonate transport system substrate-binding protein
MVLRPALRAGRDALGLANWTRNYPQPMTWRNQSSDEWDPETLHKLTEAYEEALRRAQETGTECDKSGEAAANVIAKYIIALAKRGEIDPNRLVDGALSRLAS